MSVFVWSRSSAVATAASPDAHDSEGGLKAVYAAMGVNSYSPSACVTMCLLQGVESMTISFTSVAVIAVVAVLAPLAVAFTGLRLPAIVLEILLGIVVGPQVLGWASNDEPVQVLSVIGLAFLLLLAGLEIDFDRLRGRLLRLTGLGYLVSFGIALVIGLGLRAADLVRSPLLVAIILSATGLGIILPILKDAGETSTPFGQVIVAGASIAEVGPIVLLSLFFSDEAGRHRREARAADRVLRLRRAIGLTILGLERSMRVSAVLVKLQDTTAEIRVRGAFLLLALFIVARVEVRSRGDPRRVPRRRDAEARRPRRGHDARVLPPEARRRSASASSSRSSSSRPGSSSTWTSLFHGGSTAARVPIFLAALLVVRGLPALLYRPLAERGRSSSPAGCCRRPRSASRSSPARSASRWA